MGTAWFDIRMRKKRKPRARGSHRNPLEDGKGEWWVGGGAKAHFRMGKEKEGENEENKGRVKRLFEYDVLVYVQCCLVKFFLFSILFWTCLCLKIYDESPKKKDFPLFTYESSYKCIWVTSSLNEHTSPSRV